MKKYDVSGVGLNLGTAAEYVVKTGNELPAASTSRGPSAGEGVFVVGVSKGSIADVAGIRQGDELLAIQGEPMDEATPFRASGLISGAADEDGGGAGGSGRGGSEGRSSKAELVLVKVRHAAGGEEELRLARPTRTLPSTVTTSLTRSTGGGGGAAGGAAGARAVEEVVGTVRLAAFNARAQSDVASAIRRLEAGGATRLVLDLRDNRGGLVTEGLEVARLFLDGEGAGRGFGISPDFSGAPSPEQYEGAIRGCRLADPQLPAPQLVGGPRAAEAPKAVA
ncbi:Carboxyl-terminal-processing protease [Tetrabaena socialis]|uniref:Carboxyl-terminal-processing protease n=1 Tax=Tetrabaena socialis TaxID=47790 RepID=A0A2J8A3N0_9CHLO|nr:Carboxyl-terminal-processing protease [Tetrabaena socialis]|eukprot:PNH07108.1 Carboxyl-terminal-processing protease [Tetrabaena socialis]